MKYKRYPHDPVLVRSDFHCTYCGKDLLADLDAFLSLCRDHVVPKSAGGPDAVDNRVAACAACDKLKGDALVVDVDQARAYVKRFREYHRVWFRRVRAAVRG